MTYIQREPHPHYHCLAQMSCIFSSWVLMESNDVPWKQGSRTPASPSVEVSQILPQSALQLPSLQPR